MEIEHFELERWQSTWEHEVAYNLAESGVCPLSLEELLGLGGLSAAELGQTHLGYTQTNGTATLRERVAALHPASGVDNVLVTSGSAEANFLAVWSVIEPGDEALFMVPNFMQVHGLLEAFGARVRRYTLAEARGWQPDLDEVESLVNERTKLIVVTNPNNPTGALLEAEAARRLLAAAERVGAWVLSDEVYRGAEHQGEQTPTLYNDQGYERVLVTGGLSKAYGLPGLRLGWLVGPPGLVDRAWARHDYTTIAVSALSDQLGQLALAPTTRDQLLTRTRGILATNYALVERWLAHRAETFSWVAPRAGAIAFVRYRGLEPEASRELVERIRVEQDVLVVAGADCGLEGYLRLGFGEPVDYLEPALARVGAALDRR